MPAEMYYRRDKLIIKKTQANAEGKYFSHDFLFVAVFCITMQIVENNLIK